MKPDGGLHPEIPPDGGLHPENRADGHHQETLAETATSVPVVDPMRSFRAVMAGTLVMEAIVVALALLVVTKFDGGVSSIPGIVVLALVVALLVTCGLLRYRWATAIAFALQLVMISCAFLSVPLAVIGVLFLLVWCCLLWLRREVARRMAEGSLPGQQDAAAGRPRQQ